MPGITPYLQVTKTGDAIAWYERVFGAKEVRAHDSEVLLPLGDAESRHEDLLPADES